MAYRTINGVDQLCEVISEELRARMYCGRVTAIDMNVQADFQSAKPVRFKTTVTSVGGQRENIINHVEETQ